MASVWAESIERSLHEALEMLTAAVRDCSELLWQASMWPVPDPGPEHRFLGPDWKPIDDSAERATLVERWISRWSTPWSVAWHALEVLDYDLTAELAGWSAPPPFTGHPHWRDLPAMPAPWTRDEMLGYIDYCRQRVHETLTGMTEAKAAMPLPSSHRYARLPYAFIIARLVVHTTEHAAQIRLFVTRAETPSDA